ncbi:phosphotransferase [Actinacidiphila yeochonensis]|uniref:phosphotransferase n=1 Tax=Actinacidiphila yeochonensis TaxID=89050 RepID=UPI00056994D3|nr:phosphotransferase [Actinacidiphila yeochonensis]
MTAVEDPRLRLAADVVGEVQAINGPDLPRRLLLVADSSGRRYVVKQHRSAHRFTQEVRAYTTYLTSLRDLTAELVAHDPSSRTLLLSYLPGDDCDSPTLTSAERSLSHHRAGAALRRFHDAVPQEQAELAGSYLADRMRQWTRRADQAGIISLDERRHLHAFALRLSSTAMQGSICHLDYQPRNWRLHRDEFFIVDFEHCRPDARVRDFARLEHRRWTGQPHLRDAFFAGYGRLLSDAEQQLLRLFGAIEAVTALVRGHETGDAELSAHGRALLTRLP